MHILRLLGDQLGVALGRLCRLQMERHRAPVKLLTLSRIRGSWGGGGHPPGEPAAGSPFPPDRLGGPPKALADAGSSPLAFRRRWLPSEVREACQKSSPTSSSRFKIGLPDDEERGVNRTGDTGPKGATEGCSKPRLSPQSCGITTLSVPSQFDSCRLVRPTMQAVASVHPEARF